MAAEFVRYLWLVEELLKSKPRRSTELAEASGVDRRVINDAVYYLMQNGKVVMSQQSKLYWYWPDEEFAQEVQKWLDRDDVFAWDVASRWQIAPSTVYRWGKGTARPHHFLRAAVVAWLRGDS